MTDPIKQLTLTPALTALVKDVFGPSAKLVGSELKSRLKDIFNEARERRRNENLNAHISAVRASLPKPPLDDVSYEQLDLFSDWVEGAQDINEDDLILSNIWQEILRDIVSVHSITKSLIEVMKQVDSRMARLLLSCRREQRYAINLFNLFFKKFGLSVGQQFYDEDLFFAKRLEALGLLERHYNRSFVSIFLVVFVLIIAYFTYDSFIGFVADRGLREVFSIPMFKYTVMLCIALVASIRFNRRHIVYPSFRLTWTAYELLKYAKPLNPESEQSMEPK